MKIKTLIKNYKLLALSETEGKIKNSSEEGYIALSSIIIIMAVVLSISITVTYLAIGEAQSSLSLTTGENTLSFVEGCMEDALIKAWESTSYAGGTITRPEGTCTITVAGPPGTTWTITATTTSTLYRRTVQAVATVNSSGVTLTSWKEI